jgi:hypothetical protein
VSGHPHNETENTMDNEIERENRRIALDRAVQVNLHTGGEDNAEDTVKRAEAYTAFLNGSEAS